MPTDTKGEIQHLLQNNRIADAVTLCKSLCKKNKKDAEAWFLLGSTYAQTGEFDNAIKSLRRSISINGRVAITHSNLGLIYLHKEQYKQAQNCFKKALKLEPDSVANFFNLGNTLRAMQQLEGAENAYRKALQLQPDLSGVLNNLGLTLYEKDQPEEAEHYFLRSLEIAPQQSDAYTNLSKCYREQRKTSSAKDALYKAISIHPDKPEIHWDLSLVLLELGKFKEGWDEYEWRLKGGGLMIRDFPVQKWDGEDIKEKTILVSAEQGIGDEIMFASCFPDLIQRAKKVIIDCEPRLAPLYTRSFPDAIIHSSKQSEDIVWVKEIANLDVHISAGSLPGQFRNAAEDFPVREHYLLAETTKVEAWRHRYNQLGQSLKIGISWKGGHLPSHAKRRSTSIQDWAPILKLHGIDFINLQYGEVDADINEALRTTGVTIHHWQDSDPLTDMDQFAAQIAALDLVISIDNSTVHLAGALGVPTWVLQPYCPDWRWVQQSENSYWYPGIKQFHPSEYGDWINEISCVARKLEVFLSTTSR